MKFLLLIMTLFVAVELPAAEAREPIRVYVDIVGDLFHYGHVNFFKQALEFGDELVVGLISDEDATAYKSERVIIGDRAVFDPRCRPFIEDSSPTDTCCIAGDRRVCDGDCAASVFNKKTTAFLPNTVIC